MVTVYMLCHIVVGGPQFQNWEMWWLIGGVVVAHWWRCGGSLVEVWWFIGGAVVDHWFICGGSVVEVWWFIGGGVVDHW